MLKGVISMPSNIFATTGTNVSIMFLDSSEEWEDAILMDATKLGHKEKVDGKNQRTLLDIDEINKIIEYFNNKKVEEDFSIIVDHEKIKKKKYSFSAGQYFAVRVDYVDITEEEFEDKMICLQGELDELFLEGKRLEAEIKKQLGCVIYEKKEIN